MSKICSVCAKENSAYKCPKCKVFYCSVTCCKAHKAAHHSSTNNDDGTIKTNEVEQPNALAVGPDVSDQNLFPSKQEQHEDIKKMEDIEKNTTNKTGNLEPNTCSKVIKNIYFTNIEDLKLLSAEQKKCLLQSDEIRRLLQSKRLKQQIKLIDGTSCDGSSKEQGSSSSTGIDDNGKDEGGNKGPIQDRKILERDSENRQNSLKRLREKDDEFECFVEKMLSVIRYDYKTPK